jgi:hypothetical protein
MNNSMQSQTKEIQDITEKREKNSALTVQHSLWEQQHQSTSQTSVHKCNKSQTIYA